MSEAVSESPVATPKGIRGWLILPAFGTCISPLVLIASLVATMPNYDRAWNLRGRLPAGLMAFVSVEFIGNLAFIVGWIAAVVLLVTKSRGFPRLYVGLMLGMLAFLVADLLISSVAFNISPNPSDVTSIVRTAFVSAIWCPYMLSSKRVQNTFVS
jgi:hypothetical protein